MSKSGVVCFKRHPTSFLCYISVIKAAFLIIIVYIESKQNVIKQIEKRTRFSLIDCVLLKSSDSAEKLSIYVKEV